MSYCFDVSTVVCTAGCQSWPNCIAVAAGHNTRGLILAQIIPANGEWADPHTPTFELYCTPVSMVLCVCVCPVLADVLVQALWLCDSHKLQVQ